MFGSEHESHEVERAVRTAVSPGTQLETPTGRGRFSVAQVDSDGVVLLLGKQEAWTRLTWEALEGIPDFLRGRGWVKVGGVYATTAEPGTLDAYLKGFVQRATGGWVAVLLEHSGIVEIDRSRPAAVRLKRHGLAEPPGLAQEDKLRRPLRPGASNPCPPALRR